MRDMRKKMVFYLQPTMGDELAAAPHCYAYALHETMKNLDDSNTFSVYQTSEAYGLDPTDYAFVEREWKRDEIRIRADIGLGRGKATVWTCDLTKEYVAINGDYRS